MFVGTSACIVLCYGPKKVTETVQEVVQTGAGMIPVIVIGVASTVIGPNTQWVFRIYQRIANHK